MIREPSLSPTSAARPTNASSFAIRRHWHATSHRHTSSGYQSQIAAKRIELANPVVIDGASHDAEE